MYYGDEIGMTYHKDLKSVEGGYHRTGSRTPMQWDDTCQSGFTTSNTPYISVNDNYQNINVCKQIKDNNSLLNLVKELLKLRKEEKLLENDVQAELIDDGDVLHYRRVSDLERLDIYINASINDVDISLKTNEKVIFTHHADCEKLPSMSAIITKTLNK